MTAVLGRAHVLRPIAAFLVFGDDYDEREYNTGCAGIP